MSFLFQTAAAPLGVSSIHCLLAAMRGGEEDRSNIITGSMIFSFFCFFLFLNPKIAVLLKLQSMTAPRNLLLHFQNSLSGGWDDDSFPNAPYRSLGP